MGYKYMGSTSQGFWDPTRENRAYLTGGRYLAQSTVAIRKFWFIVIRGFVVSQRGQKSKILCRIYWLFGWKQINLLKFCGPNRHSLYLSSYVADLPQKSWFCLSLTGYISGISLFTVLTLTYMQEIPKPVSISQIFLQLLEYSIAYRTPPSDKNF